MRGKVRDAEPGAVCLACRRGFDPDGSDTVWTVLGTGPYCVACADALGISHDAGTQSGRKEVSMVSPGERYPCPECGSAAIGTHEILPACALFDTWAERVCYEGTMDVWYDLGHTERRDGLPVLVCAEHHTYTHPDFTVRVLARASSGEEASA